MSIELLAPRLSDRPLRHRRCRDQVKLVTMGQPRVGGPDYVKLIENSIRVRQALQRGAG